MVMMSIVIGMMITITIGGAGEKSGAGSGEKLGELGEKLPGCISLRGFYRELISFKTLDNTSESLLGNDWSTPGFCVAEQLGRLKRPLTAPWWE